MNTETGVIYKGPWVQEAKDRGEPLRSADELGRETAADKGCCEVHYLVNHGGNREMRRKYGTACT